MERGVSRRACGFLLLGSLLGSSLSVPVNTQLSLSTATSPTCQEAVKKLDQKSLEWQEANFASADLSEGLTILAKKFLSGKKTDFELASDFTPTDPGLYDSCQALKDYHFCSLSLKGAVIRYGVCVPKGCSAQDVKAAAVPSIMANTVTDLVCDREGFAPQPAALSAMSLIIGVLAFLAIAGTALDLYMQWTTPVALVALDNKRDKKQPLLSSPRADDWEAAGGEGKQAMDDPPTTTNKNKKNKIDGEEVEEEVPGVGSLQEQLRKSLAHSTSFRLLEVDSPPPSLRRIESFVSATSLVSPPPSPTRGRSGDTIVLTCVPDCPNTLIVSDHALGPRRSSSVRSVVRSVSSRGSLGTWDEEKGQDKPQGAPREQAAVQGKGKSGGAGCLYRRMEKVLLCFSLIKGMETLLGQRSGAAYNCLDGIRGISICWIIAGHSFIFPTLTSSYSNVDFAFHGWGLTLSAMLTRSAYLGVSTFFFLSGFLAVTLFAKHLLKLRAKKGVRRSNQMLLVSVPFLCLHRWLRMLPAFVFVVAVYLTFGPYLTRGTAIGPLAGDIHNCTTKWWQSVLFISNFFGGKFMDMCYPTSWYLDVDFQLWVSTPFFVALGLTHQVAAYVVGGSLILASLVFGGIVTVQDRLTINLMNLDAFDRWLTTYYTKPWSHLGPYYVGCVTGIFWVYHGDTLKAATQVMTPRTWKRAAGAAVLSGVLLGLPAFSIKGVVSLKEEVWGVHRMAAYVAGSDAGWATGVAIMTILLILNLGGPINSLLECHVLLVLSRLSFCAYLIHPAIIHIWSANEMQPMHFNDLSFYLSSFGVAVLSFALATVVFLLVEKPFGDLSKLLLGEGKKADKPVLEKTQPLD